jgi:threonine dehydrogenase-like Zn-dependent dehydrogenase
MKAGVKFADGPGNFAVRELPMPIPGDNDVLIEVKSAAVCGVDGFLYDWTYKGRFPVQTPLVLGHECSGVIAETGKSVRGLNRGDRVTAESIIGCGNCYYCQRGLSNLCPKWDHVGITINGTFAEYLKVPATAVHRLPESVTFDQGALVEPLSITVHTFDRIKLSLGDTVLIIGPGVQGLMHAQAARSYGASKIIVMGLERDRNRLEKAEAFGADHIILSDQADPVEKVMALTNGMGADIVIDVGGTPEAFKMAVNSARGCGQVASLGYSAYGELEPIRLARQQITIFGVMAYLPKHFEYALQWMEAGKVDVGALISHELRLGEAEEGITLMRDKKATKVVLKP